MRDRDVRNAIQQALLATDAFDDVYLWGLPEEWGSGASQAAIAVIEPFTDDDTTRWDDARTGDIIAKSILKITFAQRMEDPQLCDEAVELLLETAKNALNGQDFAGLTMPALTRFTVAKWQRRKPPERRIEAIFSYQYIVSGWNAFDTEP